MSLERIITSGTSPSDYVYMSHHGEATSLSEEKMLQQFVKPKKLLPSIYIDIPENSSLPRESDDYLLENIKRFIEAGQVSNARSLLASIPFGIFSKLDNWRRVLAIPKAKSGKVATGVDINQNSSWILKNSKNFKGKWVALKKGILLGSHENRIELHRQLKISGKLNRATFFKIEKD